MSSDEDASRRDEPMGHDRPPGVWRDEERLPMSELAAAVAASASDGQVDDMWGNDAGIEGALETTEHTRDPEPDPDSAEGRRLRSGFTGPNGPH
jgi:hypothetical protein